MSDEDIVKLESELGFKREILFYQIGGGEDESDMTIWVKGDRAIMYDYQRKFSLNANTLIVIT